jgi:hypothetical protein
MSRESSFAFLRNSEPVPKRAADGTFQRTLTPEQDLWLLEAWRLRRSLGDKALARHLGITIGQLQHHLVRVRKNANRK